MSYKVREELAELGRDPDDLRLQLELAWIRYLLRQMAIERGDRPRRLPRR